MLTNEQLSILEKKIYYFFNNPHNFNIKTSEIIIKDIREPNFSKLKKEIKHIKDLSQKYGVDLVDFESARNINAKCNMLDVDISEENQELISMFENMLTVLEVDLGQDSNYSPDEIVGDIPDTMFIENDILYRKKTIYVYVSEDLDIGIYKNPFVPQRLLRFVSSANFEEDTLLSTMTYTLFLGLVPKQLFSTDRVAGAKIGRYNSDKPYYCLGWYIKRK